MIPQPKLAEDKELAETSIIIRLLLKGLLKKSVTIEFLTQH